MARDRRVDAEEEPSQREGRPSTVLETWRQCGETAVERIYVAADHDDWRRQGQEAYLASAVLVRRTYARYSDRWTHDHCEFCWATLTEPGQPGDLHEGYATPDKYRWICADCFDDFHDEFRWTVVDADGQ